MKKKLVVTYEIIEENTGNDPHPGHLDFLVEEAESRISENIKDGFRAGELYRNLQPFSPDEPDDSATYRATWECREVDEDASEADETVEHQPLLFNNDTDYTLKDGHDSCWITVLDAASVYVVAKDDSILVEILPLGDGNGQPVATAYATMAELDTETEASKQKEL